MSSSCRRNSLTDVPPHRNAAEVLSGGPGATARQVLAHADARQPTLGAGRLVCIDGPAGSGKTTLAEAIRVLAPQCRVVHMDDLFEGWDGLPEVDRQLDGLLRPMGRGHPGSYRRWDWHADRWAEVVPVPPSPLLVLEGVGSGSRAVADLVTTLVWVDAPHPLRMRRGIERDGDAFAPHWEQWAEQERLHFAAQRTRERADLVVHTDSPDDVRR